MNLYKDIKVAVVNHQTVLAMILIQLSQQLMRQDCRGGLEKGKKYQTMMSEKTGIRWHPIMRKLELL